MNIIISWQVAIGIYLLLSTTFALVYRNFAKQHPGKALLSSAVIYVLTVTPFGILWALYSGDISFGFPVHLWFFLVLGGVFFALANIIAFVANSKVDAAQFSILSNFSVITTIVISSIVLQETLSLKQLIGVAMLLSSAVIIISLKLNPKTLHIDRFTLLAILSAIFKGTGISNEKFLLDNMTFSTYLILGWGFHTLAIIVIASKHMSGAKAMLTSKSSWQLILLGLLRTFAGFALVYALPVSDNSSLISGITSYKTALVVIGSYFLLREKEHIVIQIGGTILATTGLLLLVN